MWNFYRSTIRFHNSIDVFITEIGRIAKLKDVEHALEMTKTLRIFCNCNFSLAF